jgi:hypothetical protein
VRTNASRSRRIARSASFRASFPPVAFDAMRSRSSPTSRPSLGEAPIDRRELDEPRVQPIALGHAPAILIVTLDERAARIQSSVSSP